MKNRFAVLAVLVTAVATFAPKVTFGQNVAQPAVTSLEMGSEAVVEDHAARMADQFWLDVYQKRTNGVVYYALPRFSLSFTNMSEMNNWFRAQVNQYAPSIFNSTNVYLDQPFQIYGSAQDMGDGFYTAASCFYQFNLIKSGTNYSLPDFSSLKMKLSPLGVPYHFPQIDWIVMQLYDPVSGADAGALDSRYDPSLGYTDYQDGILNLPPGYVTGNFDFRLIVVSGANYENYQVFGTDGRQIPELPITVTPPIITNGVSTVTVHPGEVGRYLILQGSTNLVNWVNLTSGYLTYFDGQDPGFSYSETNSTPMKYFRVIGYSGPY